jgi:hypothetical protein
MNVSAWTISKLWRGVVRSRVYKIMKSQAVRGLKVRYLSGKRLTNTMKLQIGT